MGVYIWNNLPSEYQEVEWIESSGTLSSGQYINTGIIPEPANTVVKLRTMPTSSSYSIYLCSCMKTYGSSQTNRYYGLSFTANRWHCGYGTADTTPGHPLVDFSYNWNWGNAIYDVEYRNDDLYVNSSLVANATTNVSNFQYPMFLFARNNDGTAGVFSSFRLYSCQIYKSGTLVRNFVPCYRKSDNVIGMYDLVNNQFYTNSGTGTFSKGSDVNNYYEKPLKNAYIGEYEFATKYQEVEYIQSSGTQYINTGYQPNNNSEIECKLNMASITNSWDSIYGATNTSSGASKRAFLLQIQKSTSKMYATIYSNYGSYQISISSASGISTNTDYTTKQSNTDFFINGVSQGTYSSSSYTVPYNMYIFGYNEGGTSKSMVSMKLYYTKIWDSGTLVRNFVPCYRKSDNVIGLYDLVNDVFYTNSGTGTFTKGLDVN